MQNALKKIPVCMVVTMVFVAATSVLQCRSPLAGVRDGQAPSDRAAAADSWFRVTQSAERVWSIDDHGNDRMYLVEGRTSALLIDTGLGVGDLTKCVGSITKLPVTVVNTHGHTDHAGGNYPFKTVHAHPADFEAIRQFGNREYRRKVAENMLKGAPISDPVLSENHESLPPPVLVPVKDGHVFDLGDRKLEVIEVPGHTPGSICILDSAHKILFSGDNDNQLVWLFLKTCTPLETYLQSLKKLNLRAGEFDVIMPGHGSPLQSAFVGEQVACAESILDGSCEARPYKSFVGNSMVCSYKGASIAYDPDNLRAVK